MQSLLKLVLKYKYSILCFIYFNIIVCFQLSFYIVHHLINVGCVFLLVFLLSKLKWTYSLIPNILLIFIIALDAYFALIYKNPLTLNVVASIFESNMTEAQGVLSLKNGIVAILVLALSTFPILMSEKELKELKFPRKYPLILVLLYSFGFVPWLVYSKVKGNDQMTQEFTDNPYLTSLTIVRLKVPLVYNNIITCFTYKKELERISRFKDFERELPDGLIHNDSIETPTKIYFILGETSYRKNYSLYGYPIKTTPFLDSLFLANPLKTAKYDAISPAALTREAIRLALTFAVPTNTNLFFTQKSIIELANQVGYETVWLSNQFSVDTFDSYTGLIANETSYSYFIPKIHSSHEDLDLIPLIKARHKTEGKQFFVIHLFGGHLPYQINMDDIDRKAIPGNDTEDWYNQSLHHTDRVIREVYNIAKKDASSIIYYIPDHGEIIGLGHGYMKAGSAQFEIPMITINNSNTPIDSIVQKYVDKETNLINSTNTSYIISEVLGFQVSVVNVKKAIENGKYILHSDVQAYPFSEILKENK